MSNTLKQLRENRKLTQEQASKILGISIVYLSNLENCQNGRKPSDKLKSKMAKLYEVSIEQIFLSINETKCFNKKKGA